MTAPRTIRAEPVIDLTTLLDGWHLLDAGIGPSGEIAVLASEHRPAWRWNYIQFDESGAPIAERPTRIRLLAPGADTTTVIDLPSCGIYCRHVQPLGRDQWLHLHHEPVSEPSSIWIVSAGGTRISAFPAGWGVDQVQSTSDGRIWVLYELESLRDEDMEFAQHGAICFTAAGDQTFRYHDLIPADQGDFPDIGPNAFPTLYWGHDLNVVSDSEIWLNSGNALIQLEHNQIAASWPPDWRERAATPQDTDDGLHIDTFAIHAHRALVAGTRLAVHEQDDVEGIFLLDLPTWHDERLHVLAPNGDALTFLRATARGALLHLITDQSIHRLDLRTL